mmetsp:Transcript_5263/g.10758  ORF Transcript_5263/g.10758 Transcript_5263/m.10758 type:complete len:818 (-) Transcript_5263:568-3021(-)
MLVAFVSTWRVPSLCVGSFPVLRRCYSGRSHVVGRRSVLRSLVGSGAVTEKERIREVQERVSRRLAEEPDSLVPVRTTIPYEFWGPLGLSPKLRRTRAFLPRGSLSSLSSFRASLRQFLLELYPTLEYDRHFGELLSADDSFYLRVNGKEADLESDEDLRSAWLDCETGGMNLAVVLTPKKMASPSKPTPLPEHLQGLRPLQAQAVCVMSFYRFIPIDDPDALADQLRRSWEPYGILGRVYVAKEGINAQISVPDNTIGQFVIRMSEVFEDTTTLSTHELRYQIPAEVRGVYLNQDTTLPSQQAPFIDLRIKPRAQVLSDGLDESLDWSTNGQAIGPEKWHQLLEEAKKENSTTLLLDCRNKYESDVGHFDGARLLGTKTFRDTWQWLEDELRDTPRDTQIMTYCTGGIRCVKVGAYLEQRMGFTNVQRLEGGIISYSRYLRESSLSPSKSHFKGVNYVFDLRIGERVTEDVLTTCLHCGARCDLQTDCANEKCGRPFADRHFVQCEDCANEMLGCCSSSCQEEVISRRSEKKDLLSAGQPLNTLPRKLKTGRLPEDEGCVVVAPKTSEYCEALTSGEPPLLKELRQVTIAELPARAHMISGPLQGRFLSMLVSLLNARSVLELGTFTGYSALWMAMSECRPNVVTCDIEVASSLIAERFFDKAGPDGSRIEFLRCSADDALDRLHDQGRSFDLVFLDANKKAYQHYYDTILDRGIIRLGGLIVADNILFRGRVPIHLENDTVQSVNREEALRQHRHEDPRTISGRTRSLKAADKVAQALHHFNQHVLQDTRTEVVSLPMRDGLSLIRYIGSPSSQA